MHVVFYINFFVLNSVQIVCLLDKENKMSSFGNQGKQNHLRNNVLPKTDNLLNLRRKLLFKNTKTTRDIPSIKELINKDSAAGEKNTVDQQPRSLDFMNKIEYHGEESLSENGIQFDWRKREDAYRITDPREFPYAVGMIVFDSVAVCSGTLLTDRWVLTARHCLIPYPTSVWVYAGGVDLKDLFQLILNSSDADLKPGVQVNVAKLVDFFIGKEHYDVGLVWLSSKFTLTDYVKTANLSSKPWKYRGYHKCVTTSFGSVNFEGDSPDDYMRKTHELDIKQPCLCPWWICQTSGCANPFQWMCAKPRQDYGICSGDSGGGLICDGQIVGINSQMQVFDDVAHCDKNQAKKDFYYYIYSYFYKPPRSTCGSKNNLDTFLAVCPVLHWINERVKVFSDDEISECINLPSAGSLSDLGYQNFVFIFLIAYIKWF